MLRSFLYHAAGIGSLSLTILLLLLAYLVRGDGLAYVLLALAAAPGFVGGRWVFKEGEMMDHWLFWVFCAVLAGASVGWVWHLWPK